MKHTQSFLSPRMQALGGHTITRYTEVLEVNINKGGTVFEALMDQLLESRYTLSKGNDIDKGRMRKKSLKFISIKIIEFFHDNKLALGLRQSVHKYLILTS